jgi:hypothetical protein
MAILVPPPFDLAFTMYGLSWPDIDEDKVAEFGILFDSVCEATVEFGQAINGLLGTLSSESKSEAFDAVVENWSTFCNDGLFSTVNAAGDAVETTSGIAANVITSYKMTLISILTVNVAADLAAIASGVGAPAAAARIAVMRVLLRIAFEEAVKAFAGLLVDEFNRAFDDFVIKPIEELFRGVRDAMVQHLAGVASSDPTVRAATLSTAGALYLDFHDVVDATVRIKATYDDLETALNNFAAQFDGEDLAEPNHNGAPPDFTVRTLVKEALQWSVGAVIRLLADVGKEVVHDLVNLVTETYAKYVEADTELARRALALRDTLELPPPRLPYVIDRSTRPQPIMIWENPPDEVFTGAAVSDARFEIVMIDLPDAPEPITTGVAASDVSKGMTKIQVPDFSAQDGVE